MELKEFYSKIEGDYEGTIGRLYKEELIKKFVGKFLQDKSFEELCENLKNNNLEDAFRSVHTLKGVAVNLGFTKLYQVSSTLTEALRNKEYDSVEDIEDMFADVEAEYKFTIQTIGQLME